MFVGNALLLRVWKKKTALSPVLTIRKCFFPRLVAGWMVLVGWLGVTTPLFADARESLYHMELGIEGGCAYYAGDATQHIFQNVRETYGVAFRYQLNRRWAVRAKGMTLRITGPNPDGMGFADKQAGTWTNCLVNLDVVGEFNFLPYGRMHDDSRISAVTPYIGLGIGTAAYSDWQQWGAYIPFIIGLKWQIVPRLTLHVLWQHNVYFADNLEGIADYNNKYDLNGKNLFNCDITGQLALGLAFSFLPDKKICRTCQ